MDLEEVEDREDKGADKEDKEADKEVVREVDGSLDLQPLLIHLHILCLLLVFTL